MRNMVCYIYFIFILTLLFSNFVFSCIFNFTTNLAKPWCVDDELQAADICCEKIHDFQKKKK